MNDNQKLWNANQKILRQKLEKAQDFEQMKPLLLSHHQMTHASTVGNSDSWSYEDELWHGINDSQARQIPQNQEHSFIWIFWHLARVEDITMNLLLAGQSQVLYDDDFLARAKSPIPDTGNEITREKMTALNQTVDIAELRAYRIAVGQRTQAIIQNLRADDLLVKVDPARIAELRASDNVIAAASGIIDYWSKRTTAGLLLMPATRHNFVHLNEAARIKKALLS